MSGGGGGGENTVTQVQQIPEFEQEASRANQALAQSIGSQPFPVYQGALIQGQTPLQTQGQNAAVGAANAYQPGLQAATGYTQNALDPSGVNSAVGAASGQIQSAFGAPYSGALNATGNATALSNPNAVSQFMSPYIEQALAPQVQDLQIQLGQQQRGIDQQATQANAFGDARQGAAQALQNLYGNQAMTQLLGQGYNNAYGQAQQALAQQQGIQLGAAQQYGNLINSQLSGAGQYANLGNLLGQEQGTQLSGANQLGSLAGLAQQYGITGANATYNAGQQQQQLGQQELSAAYQQFLNQVNWPVQMLNVQESALSNSPYNIATATTLPAANTTAQGFGTAANLSGLLGSFLGGGSGSANNSPFGGTSIQGAR